jgi:hypothetical protein
MRAPFALAVAGLITMVSSVQAQDERIRVGFNVGSQVPSQTVSQEFTRTLYLEDAPISNTFDLSGGALFDVGGWYKVTETLWAGVSFSSISRKSDGEIEAQLPHPFFFNRLRDAAGTLADLESKETGLHFDVMYVRPLMEKLDLGVFFGVSRFGVSQELITNIEIDEAFPYDTADISDADVVKATGSAIGFNVGADVTYRLTDMFGVGGLIRFARGSVTLEPEPGEEVEIDAGGLAAGVGVRVIF